MLKPFVQQRVKKTTLTNNNDVTITNGDDNITNVGNNNNSKRKYGRLPYYRYSSLVAALILFRGFWMIGQDANDFSSLLRYLCILHDDAAIGPSKEATSERIYDNLIFTSEKCNELSVGDEFDVCAILEFCTTTNNNDNDESSMEIEKDEEVSSPTTSTNNKEEQDEVPHVLVARMAQEVTPNNDDDNSNNNSTNDNDDSITYMKSIDNTAIYGYKLEGSNECLWPGPIMRLQQGKKHGLFLRGAEEKTNLHLQGLNHANVWKRSDWMYRSVQGKDNLLIYEIDLEGKKMVGGGTHWYHSHLQDKAWEQVREGAFGMIVIDDDEEGVGTNDPNVLEFLNHREKILILDDTHGGVKKHQNNFVANGQIESIKEEDNNIGVLEFVSDEWYRLRILLVSVDSHRSSFTLQFTEDSSCQVHALAHDGILRFEVPKEESSSNYYLTTGSRLDVAIRCNTQSDISINNQIVTKIKIIQQEDATTSRIDATPFEGCKDNTNTTTWYSNRHQYLTDLRQHDDDIQSFKLRVDETNINEIHQASKKPVCYGSSHKKKKNSEGTDFISNTIYEWDLHGVMVHPFHLHQFPMQIVSEGCGPHHEIGQFYDTIHAPESSISNKCLVRINTFSTTEEQQLPVMLQCSIFQHRQQGAIAYLNVLSNTTAANDDPNLKTCIGTCDENLELPSKCQ